MDTLSIVFLADHRSMKSKNSLTFSGNSKHEDESYSGEIGVQENDTKTEYGHSTNHGSNIFPSLEKIGVIGMNYFESCIGILPSEKPSVVSQENMHLSYSDISVQNQIQHILLSGILIRAGIYTQWMNG
jgi:hypothetical protein